MLSLKFADLVGMTTHVRVSPLAEAALVKMPEMAERGMQRARAAL